MNDAISDAVSDAVSDAMSEQELTAYEALGGMKTEVLDMHEELSKSAMDRAKRTIERFAPTPVNDTSGRVISRSEIIESIGRTMSPWILRNATSEELADIHTALTAARRRSME